MNDEQRRKNSGMHGQDSQHSARPTDSTQHFPTTEYDLLDVLDRLESLVEDMDDLAVATRDEAEALIARIHARLDDLDQANP